MLNFEELEETLTRLDSVDAVRVVGDGTKVAEVHVVASLTKPAKQVVRDVQSLAMARYGTNIDRRVISVVQLAGKDIRRHTPERPVIVGIKEEPDGSRLTVRVTLGWQQNDHVGIASWAGGNLGSTPACRRGHHRCTRIALCRHAAPRS